MYINIIGVKSNNDIDVQLSLGMSKDFSVKLSIVNNKNNIMSVSYTHLYLQYHNSFEDF